MNDADLGMISESILLYGDPDRYETVEEMKEIASDLASAARRLETAIAENMKKRSACPRCEGTGKYQRVFGPKKDCAVCNGTGSIQDAG